MELLAPAGNFASARSAVNNGADAIYAGGPLLNARRASAGFTGEELARLVAFCHLRRVKVYVTVNTMTREDEIPALLELAQDIAASGADAAIVADLGVARVLREVCPSLPLHASTQMNIHSLSGVRYLEKLGFRRVVLARELSLQAIRHICRHAEMEIEIFAHGSLCMSYSGNCYLSSVIGGKSGNRGLCAQPCRLPDAGGRYPLSLKDLAALENLNALKEAGVASLKIEGRLKSPEYVGSVTAAYRRALEGQTPGKEDLARLEKIFSRSGFTCGYLSGRRGPAMFGTKTKTEYADYKEAVAPVSETLKAGYEPKKRAVSFRLLLRENLCRLWVSCEGFTAEISGPPPAPALKRAVSAEDAERALSKLGGTPFTLDKLEIRVDQDLYYPAAAFNDLRRRALEAAAAFFTPVPHPFSSTTLPAARAYPAPEKAALEGWFWNPEDLPKQPERYLSRWWLNGTRPEKCRPYGSDARAGIFLPAFLSERELEQLGNRLYTMGFRHVLCRNLGQITPLKAMGFTLHGDYALNLANAQALAAFQNDLADATLSFELTLRQICALPKPLPVGLIVYGRLPLMETANCLIRNLGPCKNGAGSALRDRTGRVFPAACGHGCNNTLFNSVPLFLADRNREWQETGVSFGRLLFTGESPEEIIRILRAYKLGTKEKPAAYTRGLYYRGVL